MGDYDRKIWPKNMITDMDSAPSVKQNCRHRNKYIQTAH